MSTDYELNAEDVYDRNPDVLCGIVGIVNPWRYIFGVDRQLLPRTCFRSAHAPGCGDHETVFNGEPVVWPDTRKVWDQPLTLDVDYAVDLGGC